MDGTASNNFISTWNIIGEEHIFIEDRLWSTKRAAKVRPLKYLLKKIMG